MSGDFRTDWVTGRADSYSATEKKWQNVTSPLHWANVAVSGNDIDGVPYTPTCDDLDGIPYKPEKRKSSEMGNGEPQEKKKFAMNFGAKAVTAPNPLQDKTAAAKVTPIKMALGQQKPKQQPSVKPKPAKVAQIFNEDSSDEEEEMPPEAKMKMRNIGRETPTAAGPNSFGKGKLGFCDRSKLLEKELKKKMEEVSGDNEWR
ncbi:hypothetical protein FSP39_005330 [Pinctada imbricata]|uniref:PEST proteolytic signal-containing nuclear protein n=1 Tax=Pinctada imbricata TaxID=66713 RepID=A0AA88YC33_PINIB|nr:hypothetical protein FSP39_005330 [Pinctada imbricata]